MAAVDYTLVLSSALRFAGSGPNAPPLDMASIPLNIAAADAMATDRSETFTHGGGDTLGNVLFDPPIRAVRANVAGAVKLRSKITQRIVVFQALAGEEFQLEQGFDKLFLTGTTSTDLVALL